MGDVLLTLPVLRGILDSNPGHELVFVTRKKFIPYFAGIDRLILVSFDPENQHKGLSGILRLFLELRRYGFRTLVDLHGNLRTSLIDGLFILTGCRIYRVKKHRKLRRLIISRKLVGTSVPQATDRYLQVFEKAGVSGKIIPEAVAVPDLRNQASDSDSGILKIGIAPLSKHQTKNWGLDQVKELISLLRMKYPVEIHLFGGPEDHDILDSLTAPRVINHAGTAPVAEELMLIRSIDVFISMDSANMHLASLAGVPTLSVWGPTDPSLGFAAVNQPAENSLFADPAVVTCRPCSVYGEIPCRRTDSPMICMKLIKPEMVLEKINQILAKSGRKFTGQ